uniref:Uncharacterized protein n=1 Tax=Terrapene triunguis TaxID=2587831 RepID=A0A674JXE1_9SAUR
PCTLHGFLTGMLYAGVQEAVVTCLNKQTREIADETLCVTSRRPPQLLKACNLEPCPPRWEIGKWSSCSLTCGVGLQTRDVFCSHLLSRETNETLPETFCSALRPVAQQACKNKDCPSEWLLSDWTQVCGICISEESNTGNRSHCPEGNSPSFILLSLFPASLALSHMLPMSPQSPEYQASKRPRSSDRSYTLIHCPCSPCTKFCSHLHSCNPTEVKGLHGLQVRAEHGPLTSEELFYIYTSITENRFWSFYERIFVNSSPF